MAILVPPVLTGYHDIQLAEADAAAARYSSAARLYVLASRLLPWRHDLREPAGIAAYAAGDFPAAIGLLNAAAVEGGLSSQGWEDLGSAYWTIGDRASAIASWRAGSRAHPADARLLDSLAAAYDQQSDYASEQTALQRRLQLGDDAAAHYRLGLILMLSDPSAASPHIQAAARLDAAYRPAADTLLAALKTASEQQDASRSFVVLGRALGLVQEWPLALREFGGAVELDPRNPEALAWLGEARQHVGQDGRPDLDRALLLGPRDGMVRALRAIYFRRQGESAQALNEYRVAVQLEPTNPAFQSALGDSYASTGDLVAALKAYQNATTLSPANATYWRLLALFCADNSVQVADIGLPAAQKAALLAPKDAAVLDALGWSYAQAGYYDQGRKTLQRAIDASAALAEPHLHLALIDLRLGQNPEALAQLKLALQADPSGPAAKSAQRLLDQYFPNSQ